MSLLPCWGAQLGSAKVRLYRLRSADADICRARAQAQIRLKKFFKNNAL
jgi:hypothetical protein